MFRRDSLLILIGLALLTGGTAGLVLRVDFFSIWYYDFAWWGYILVADGYLSKQGRTSIVLSRGFLLLCFGSAVLWFGFETINLRLQNWVYIELPQTILSRWLGYWVSYATILPGIFVTERLLDHWDFLGSLKGSLHRYPRYGLIAMGFCFLALSLVWPLYFFPLVWGAFFLILDPINAHKGQPSLLQKWVEGDVRTLLRFLSAGFICGGLWELWNFWATSKWVYTVPWVGHWKFFEMPILGYLGFPPFALECFAITEFCRGKWKTSSLLMRSVLILVGGIFGLWVCRQIDLHTVRGLGI